MTYTFPFNSIKPSGSSSYSRMFVWCVEVRKQLRNLCGLASDERKEVKGTVISLLEFFLWGEEEIVSFALGFYWWMRLSYESREWDHS